MGVAMGALLGIDIGGTSIKAGLFDDCGELLRMRSIPTGKIVDEGAYEEICYKLDLLLADVDDGNDQLIVGMGGMRPSDVIAVGLDVPGPVDAKGNVGVLSNIELNPDGLCQAIRAHFPDAELAFVNDANAAAAGELWRGAAMGLSSAVMVTLGTGVGGGVILDGRLVSGAFGAGGEIGHIKVRDDETRSCGCGRRGCLEQYASATGLVRVYKDICFERGCAPAPTRYPSDSLAVFNAREEGDECAQAAIDTMADYLALAFSQISVIVDPEAFIVGGGMAGSFDVFSDRLHSSFEKLAFDPCKKAMIIPAKLGNRAGMYGCAYEALRVVRSVVA